MQKGFSERRGRESATRSSAKHYGMGFLIRTLSNLILPTSDLCGTQSTPAAINSNLVSPNAKFNGGGALSAYLEARTAGELKIPV
jgi:hypothetical protein